MTTSRRRIQGPEAVKAPARVWDAPYAHGRRRHRHRCRYCNRIMAAGTPALWCRLGPRTYVLHATCAERAVLPSHPDHSWRDQFEAWAAEAERKLREMQ